jgi:CRISPR-associated protein Cmr6
MEQSRRDRLLRAQRQSTTHAGLWLDKFLAKQIRKDEKLSADQRNPLAQLMEEVATLKPPSADDAYAKFFQRWQDALVQIGAVSKQAKVLGRLSIGLGAEGVLETAITLHHTYGVPYIPGSALKGLAASYARKRLEKEDWGPKSKNGAYKILFGDTDSAGYVTFFDALCVPGSGHQGQALYPDVITVHHPDYYQGDQAPADWDNPTPIPFLSATGDYLLALGGDPQWVEAAYKILALALSEEGVGAKTSSGYGRMTVAGMVIEDATQTGSVGAKIPSSADPDQGTVDSFLLRLRGMSNARLPGEIQAVYQQWVELTVSGENRQALAQAILDKIEAAGRTRKSLGQAWYQELLAAAGQTK